MIKRTKEEHKIRIMYSITILFVILIVISLILIVMMNIGSHEDIKIMLYGLALFSIIYTISACINEASAMKTAMSENDRIKKNAKKLEYITPGLVELLFDFEVDDFDKEIAVLAGLVSKGYITVDSSGKVIQQSVDRKKWLEHEKLVFDKYKNNSYIDIPNYLQILINDASKLLLLKKQITEKKYKLMQKVFCVSFIITAICLLLVIGGYLSTLDTIPYLIVFCVAHISAFITFFSIKTMLDYNTPVDDETLYEYYFLTDHGEKVKKEIEEFRKALYECSLHGNEKLTDEEKYVDIIPFVLAIGEKKILENRASYDEKYKNLLVLMNMRVGGEQIKDELAILKNVEY